MKNTTKERLNLSITRRTKERIDELQALTDASTSAEVIKKAILTYEAMAKLTNEGCVFYIERDGQPLIPFDFSIDVPGRRLPIEFRVIEGSKMDDEESAGEKPALLVNQGQ